MILFDRPLVESTVLRYRGVIRIPRLILEALHGVHNSNEPTSPGRSTFKASCVYHFLGRIPIWMRLFYGRIDAVFVPDLIVFIGGVRKMDPS